MQQTDVDRIRNEEFITAQRLKAEKEEAEAKTKLEAEEGSELHKEEEALVPEIPAPAPADETPASN